MRHRRALRNSVVARAMLLQPACIGVTLQEIFETVRPSETIWLDDGKIGGIIQRVDGDRLELLVAHARPGGSRLRADKGINLPDSDLHVPALTRKDREDLRFIAAHADIVGYSLVQKEADVRALQSQPVTRTSPRPRPECCRACCLVSVRSTVSHSPAPRSA